MGEWDYRTRIIPLFSSMKPGQCFHVYSPSPCDANAATYVFAPYAGFLRSVLREGVYLYTMTPSRIANKLRGECSYHTPTRVVLSTKKLGNNV
jgi:hypothetical protein